MKRVLYLLPILLAFLAVETAEAKKVKYPNGDYYVGKWKKKTPHGEGTMKYANGNVYVGLWEYGVRSGEGKMTYRDNSVYEGNWQSNKRYGHGKYTTNNGDVYEGSFVEDLYHGQGVYTYVDGTIYEGSFYRGFKDGQGKQQSSHGDWWEGTWRRDVFTSGQCSYKEDNGTTFKGRYENGKIKEGKLIHANGDWFEGIWDNDKFDTGKCQWTDYTGGEFSGTYKDGIFSQGELTTSDGSWYKGTWKNGVFYKGDCKEINSSHIYEGSVENGKPYTGVADGRWGDNYYKGEFLNGVFIRGECELKTFAYSFKGHRTEDLFSGTMKYSNGFVYEGDLNVDLEKAGKGTFVGDSDQENLQGEFLSDYLVKGKGTFTNSSKEYNFAIETINEDDYNVKIYDNGKLYLNDNMPIFETDSVFEKMNIALEEKMEKERQEKIMAESRAFCKKHFAGHVYKANSVSWNSSAEGAWLMGTIMDIKVTLRFVSSDKAEYTVHAQMTNALDDNPFVRMQLESVCNEMDGMTETVEYKYVDEKLYIDNVECSTGNNFKNIQFDMGMWNCWLKQVK